MEEDFDFDSKKFEGYNFIQNKYDEENDVINSPGLTLNGFKRVLMEKLSPDELRSLLTVMGYDESLYSVKSRIIVCSLHADAKITTSIGDTFNTRVVEAARDLVMEHVTREEGAGRFGKETDQCVIVVKSHRMANAKTIGVLNKTEEPITVTIDMTESEEHYFTPSSGVVRSVIPPNGMKYVCSAILDHKAEKLVFKYSVEVE